MKTGKYVFMDRDGTIIKNKGYLSDPDGIEILPGVTGALRELASEGFRFAIITNQSGIARGLLTVENVESVNERLAQIMLEEGVHFDGMYYCPHNSEDGCSCRKPEPGLLIKAMRALDADARVSYMVGDKLSDALSGARAGMTGVVIGRLDCETPNILRIDNLAQLRDRI